MLCPRCSVSMVGKKHFEKGRQWQYNECPKCYDKTKNKRIHFEDILNEKIRELETKPN